MFVTLSHLNSLSPLNIGMAFKLKLANSASNLSVRSSNLCFLFCYSIKTNIRENFKRKKQNRFISCKYKIENEGIFAILRKNNSHRRRRPRIDALAVDRPAQLECPIRFDLKMSKIQLIS